MNSLYEKIKIWGVKGILNFFIRQFRTIRLRTYFKTNLLLHPHKKPSLGFTIIAPLSGAFSISKAMRDLLHSLKDANIPYQTFDLSQKKSVTDPLLTPKSDFHLARHTHIIDFEIAPLPSSITRNHTLFHTCFWEFESGLTEFIPSLAKGPAILAFSDFNLEVFKKQLPPSVTIRKLLYPFRFIPLPITPPFEIRSRYGFTQNDFIVFYNFDYGSSYFRKNPEGALRAFAQAFASTPNAHLLLKTNHAADNPSFVNTLKKLAEVLAISSKIHTIDEYLCEEEIYAITAATDIYLSLHRGEGFGLGIAEAMYLGKPVVLTDYSAPKEFCTPENSILIPYSVRQTKLGTIDNSCYHYVTSVAEPDIPSAANALRRLYDSPSLRLQLGEKAAAFIRNHFSTKKFRTSALSILAEDSPENSNQTSPLSPAN